MKGPENCITLLAKNVQFNEVNDGGSKIFIRISISIAMALTVIIVCSLSFCLSPQFHRSFLALLR